MNKKNERTFIMDWDVELKACMDYIHGDVDGEAEAACMYEYARESEVLRNAAAVRDQLRKTDDWRDDDVEMIVKADLPPKFRSHGWLAIISECASFPQFPWKHLESGQSDIPGERELILKWWRSESAKPFSMTPLRTLDRNGVFEDFRIRAENMRIRSRKNLPNPKPVKEEMPVIYYPEGLALALFDLDFTHPKKRLLEEFDAWLNLPKNKVRFAEFKRDGRGKGGEFKSRLKDLAVWRLRERLSYEGMRTFTRENRKKTEKGLARPFHDSRRDQAEKGNLHEAELFSDKKGCEASIRRAKEFLKSLFPAEPEERPERLSFCEALQNPPKPSK